MLSDAFLVDLGAIFVARVYIIGRGRYFKRMCQSNECGSITRDSWTCRAKGGVSH